MNYAEKLQYIQSELPFDYWPNEGSDDADEGEGLFYDLIDQLIAFGQDGDLAAKTEAIQAAVLALNRMHTAHPDLIETEEREDICEMLNEIAAAAGIDVSAYAKEGSIADLWREW
jgi:hypothetical protein